MIFDFTDLEGGINERYKPRNHITVEGYLYHGEEQIASLRTLALVYSNHEYDLAGGRFTLAWHKMRGPIAQPLRLEAVLDDDRNVQCGPLRWVVDDIQILFDGTPVAIGSFNELLGGEVVFFGRRAARQHLVESA